MEGGSKSFPVTGDRELWQTMESIGGRERGEKAERKE